MSNPPARPAPLSGTRQQLDELDALLQRMLSLPVGPPEEPAAEEAPAAPETPDGRGEEGPTPGRPANAYPASYMVVEMSGPHLGADEPAPPPGWQEEVAPEPAPVPPEGGAGEPEAGEVWVPLRSSWQPSPQTWGPLADTWLQANGDGPIPPPPPAPVPAPEPVAAEVPLAPPQPAPRPPAPAPAPPPARAGHPWWQWPLVPLNASFDLLLLPWGAPGRWFRGRVGRALLGAVGLLCLAAAAALAAADGIGWTW